MANTNNIQWKRITVEGATIVVSILLAFGIEAWWQDRNEAVLEQRLLTALLAEFEQNGDLLREAREVYERRYMRAVRILEYMEQEPDEIDEAEFERLVRGIISNRTFHLESGAHDGLLASGELSLIHDETLRNRLAAWPSYVAEWSEEEAAVFSFVKEELTPYLSDRIRLRNVSLSLPPFPDGQSPPPIPVGLSDAISLVSLSTSLEFDNLVYQSARAAGTPCATARRFRPNYLRFWI